MGKDTVATRRGGAKGRKPVRQKVRYTTSEPFPWLTPRENKKTKKAKSSKLTCGDLDELLELLRSPASPPSPPSPMSYEDWVVEENDKAGRVLSQLAQLLGMTVNQMKDIEYEMYNDEESLTACGNICLVYAGGLMMRWVRMVPLEAMRIWTDGGPASVYDNSALSAELLARRWQKLRSLGPVYVAAIFTISMCVATKQINTPLYHFQLEYCMPALRRNPRTPSKRRTLEEGDEAGEDDRVANGPIGVVGRQGDQTFAGMHQALREAHCKEQAGLLCVVRCERSEGGRDARTYLYVDGAKWGHTASIVDCALKAFGCPTTRIQPRSCRVRMMF